MSGFNDQNQAPNPRNHNRIDQRISLYLDFDEEGLVPEDYVSLVPEIMIPVALEAEVQDLLVIEEREDAIWFHIGHIEYDDEGLVEPMEEDYEDTHHEDERNDEATDEGTENVSGIVNDHNYACTGVAPNEAESKEKADTDKKNQKDKDDNNPHS